LRSRSDFYLLILFCFFIVSIFYLLSMFQLPPGATLFPYTTLFRSEGEDLVDMIKENLVAERIAIETYSEIVRYLGNDDPTTRRMMEGILAQEEEHAEDMATLLEELGRKGEPASPR